MIIIFVETLFSLMCRDYAEEQFNPSKKQPNKCMKKRVMRKNFYKIGKITGKCIKKAHSEVLPKNQYKKIITDAFEAYVKSDDK